MNAIHRAAFAQGVLAAYLQVIEWIPLPPWNDLSRGNGQEVLDIVLAVLSVALIIGTLRRSRFALWAGVLALVGWLWLQIQTWWIPYATGGSAQWRRVHARWFANNLRFLPEWGDHPVPDAAHTVLHVLIVVALTFTVLALRKTR